ncbi:MAG: hypothetical protein KY455_01605 [Euryarchaeota archaeon]|nr:hypothetical protein [Euryarchaeota archaeon]
MRAPTLVIVGLLLTVAVGDLVSQPFGSPAPNASAAIGSILDDGGIGGDAGNTRATASTLSTFDTFTAGLSSKDTDWYTYPAGTTSGPGCVSLTSSGTKINDRLLESGGTTVTTTDIGTTLTLALPALDPVYVAFNDALPQSGTTTEYSFATDHVLPAADDGKGGPAKQISDPCTTGSVGANGDRVDIYEVEVQAGDRLVFSLGADADSGLKLTLVGKGKKAIDSVGPGEPLVVEPDKDGTVRLAVSDVMGGKNGGSQATFEGTLLGIAAEAEAAQAVEVPYVIGACRPLCILQ